VILRNKQADDFVKNPSDDIQGILLHGQDSGLINYRTKALVNHYIPNQNDPFLLSTINSNQLNDDPGLLADELDTFALTNDRRVILLDLSSDLNKEQVDCIINSKSQSILIINAGELKTGSPSRKVFETDKNFIVIPCYNSSNIDIMTLLNNKLKERNLTMHKDAKDLIVGSLGNDYGNTISEIEKIINYHRSNDEISKSEVESIMVSSSNIIITDLVDMVFEKKTKSISPLYHAVIDEFSPAQILIITSNHVIKLMELLAEKNDSNLPNKQVIENSKPPIFFKRHSSLQKQLNTWNRGNLDDIIEILSETTIETRKNSDLSVELTERCLLKISSLKS
jgi:DNA polymerase-3 subunit delta